MNIFIKSATIFIISMTFSMAASQPQTFLLNAETLGSIAESIRSGEPTYQSAARQLVRDANKALRITPISVIDKGLNPPGGDKHDYMSMGSYWWPNPESPDGLPYIRRDGFANPEAGKCTDRQNLVLLVESVSTLALAYYYTGKADYADHAARMIRTWFLDPATRMNPNMNFSQSVPGRNNGRGSGILDAKGFVEVIDAIGLLAGSAAWTSSDQKEIREWFSKYYAWLLQSKKGKSEWKAKNNHGTWFDVQAVSIALFLGKNKEAARIIEKAKTSRIALQIEPDGSQPNELIRTRSWDYSIFSLDALFHLAALANSAGVDLWSYTTADGRGIRQALDYLIPYMQGEKKWLHPNLGGVQEKDLYTILLQAASNYRDPNYYYLARDISRVDQEKNRNLLYYGIPKFNF